MKIGIVGSGIAGLTAAYRLHRAGHQVAIFEKQNSLGMDASSLPLNFDSVSVRADVPSRMFNELQWPNLLQLYREAGVEFQQIQATQSFNWFDGKTYLTLDVANRPWLAAKALLSPRYRKVASEAKRLQSTGNLDLKNGLGTEITLGSYLVDSNFDSSFVYEFLFPTLSSTVFTCSYQALDKYPAVLVLQALKNLSDSPSLLRTRHGTQDVVSRLTAGIGDIRLGTAVSKVQKIEDHVEVAFGECTEIFDHLIIATQANQATRLCPNSPVHAALQSVQYEDVQVVVHTDTRLMPSGKQDWATFNMVSQSHARTAMCSVWLNQFHDDWALETPIFETINPLEPPEKSKTISSVTLQRPIVTAESFETWQAFEEYHQSRPKVWFVGSYAFAGVPLLETGVQSSQNVVHQILKFPAAVRF